MAEERGRPRCYFCGALFASEAEVKKTEHNIGNGHRKYVYICSRCKSKGMASTGCLVWLVAGVGGLVAAATALAAR